MNHTKRIGIVILPDQELRSHAIELSQNLERSSYSLAKEKRPPHISLLHLETEESSYKEVLTIAQECMRILYHEINTFVMGEMEDISIERNKWIFWNVKESKILRQTRTWQNTKFVT